MSAKTIDEVMLELKKLYDRSKEREKWRVLTGRNPKDSYDTFITTDKYLWQLKSEFIGPGQAVGVGSNVRRIDDEIRKVVNEGTPTPFGMLVPQNREVAIILAGIQKYSSESVDKLARYYASDKQSELEEKLDEELEKLMQNPNFRKEYERYKERSKRPYG
ncbi:MAG: hypothetical protein ACUVXA_18970 [Candidatus Jordarchaeum sp.]|uniref:hypothetical protein n=1 Tax=Candidatus Jordarchaeum sp. TaxID=2823881 RepID=UPI00404AA92E